LAQLDRRHARLIVDLLRHEIVVDGRAEDMSRRETLLPLVRELLIAPGMRLSAGELVRRAWGFEYHPLNHRERLSMASTRLRKLFGAEQYESGRDSYGLRASVPWILIEPGAPRSATPAS